MSGDGFTCARHGRYVPAGELCPFHEDGDASAAGPTVEREALKVALGESPRRRLVPFRGAPASLVEVERITFGEATLFVNGVAFPVHVKSVTWHARYREPASYEITGIVLDEAAALPAMLGHDDGGGYFMPPDCARAIAEARWFDAADGAGPYRVLGRTRTEVGWRERRQYQARSGDSLYDVIDPAHAISAEALPGRGFVDHGVFDATAGVWLRRGVEYAFEGGAYLFATEIQAHTVSITVRGGWVVMQPESGHYVWDPITEVGDRLLSTG